MTTTIEILETTPNVKLVRDSQGRNWICDANISGDADLSKQACVLADEIIYDRNFGG